LLLFDEDEVDADLILTTGCFDLIGTGCCCCFCCCIMGVEETGQLLENPTKLNELGDSAPEFLLFELSPNAFFSTDCAYKRHASSLLLAVYLFLFLRFIKYNT
jgi:hypothetical protein